MLTTIYLYRISHFLYVCHIPLSPKFIQLFIFYNYLAPYKLKNEFFDDEVKESVNHV